MLSLAVVATSCYDDLVQDYTRNGAYFSYQNPLRTVIAERDGMAEGNAITVGCAIGGKTVVDQNDWVSFEIDESLITPDMGLVVMPEEYYTLSNSEMMTISKSNNFIADTEVHFTEAFFNDEKAAKQYYAIPFRATGTNLDLILEDKNYSVVAVKFISRFHGSYYVQGEVTLLNADGSKSDVKTTYNNADLSQNQSVDFTTISKRKVERPAETLLVGDKYSIERNAFTLSVTTGGDVVFASSNIVAGSATASVEYNGTSHKCSFAVSYKIKRDGKTYLFEESYTRRQDPLKDLTLEYWVLPEDDVVE